MTHKHILTKRNLNGGFDAVGMNNRSCLTHETPKAARKIAVAWANQHGVDVRFQTWREHRFYIDEKPDAQEIIKPRVYRALTAPATRVPLTTIGMDD